MMREMVSEDVAAAVTRDIEGEAHSFAANLLMPKRRVLGMVPTHASVSQILAAKHYFKVSAMAMARRAYELGRLSEWEYRQVCSELTVQGYKSGEPRDLRPEQSKVFRFVADTKVVPEFLRTLVFARPRGDDQFADCTFSPSLDMSR